jgi:hypothetical protein
VAGPTRRGQTALVAIRLPLAAKIVRFSAADWPSP